MIDAKTAKEKSQKTSDIFNKFNVSEDEQYMFISCLEIIRKSIENSINSGKTATKAYSIFFHEGLKKTIVPKVISYMTSLGYKINYDFESKEKSNWFDNGTHMKTDWFFNICWNNSNNTDNCCPFHCPIN